MDQRANFLALILLDALEDENECDVYNILKRNSVDASYVPLERGIAPMHYVCGMEKESLALDIMKRFLNNGADPNVRSDENMTPMHVAAIYGRVELVKLLLEHGGLLDVWDDNRKMPVHYAIDECHFDVVQMMRDHIFLKKYEKKKQNIHPTTNGASRVHSLVSESRLEQSFEQIINENKNISTPVKSKTQEPVNKHLQVPGMETNPGTPGGSKYTPNRVHYNYDVTSPYYINITHRRHKPQPLFPPNGKPKDNDSEEKESSSETEDSSSQSVNLFALTKENLQELSERLPSTERSRISMIETWREKVRQSRARQSIIKEFHDPEELIDNVMANDHLNFTNTLYKEKKTQKEQEADSGACDSGSVISLNETLEEEATKEPEEPKRYSPHATMSLGQLIQKVSRAHLVDASSPNANNLPNPWKSPSTKPNQQKDSPNSSFKTVPEIVSPKQNKDKDEAFKKLKNEENFIQSPKPVGEYFLQMTEAYVHTDDENGLVFYEKKLLSNEQVKKVVKLKSIPERNASSRIQNMEQHDTSATSRSTDLTLPLDYETDALRNELTSFGEAPGPITKSTKRLYIKRLIKYRRNTALIRSPITTKESKFSVELQRTLNNLENFEKISNYLLLESQSAEFFANMKQKKNMREGHLKQSFIYMLIDPRISANLPGESVYLDKLDIWKRFLDSIFYVGKGKTSRPYSHLYDAMKTHSRLYEQQNNTDKSKKFSVKKTPMNVEIFKSPPAKTSDSKKLDRILDIWGNGSGVVCLHVFHNIVPIDAYTREAAIIDALSLKHLTNCKRGDYYGPSKTWTMKDKKFLGIALLYKAMQIFLAEGESQLSPSDLI